MKRWIVPVLLVFSFLLTACTGGAAASPAGSQSNTPQAAPANTEAAMQPDFTPAAPDDLKRTDGQGNVTVEVTPLNLSDSTDAVTLDFDVSLNTHSVDLSMDLAPLTTLTTDTGVSEQATKWEATPGGHHVSGKLIFAATKDGKGVLEGASKLTLTIANLDAPSRVFEWPLK